jgi:hypothetical protein
VIVVKPGESIQAAVDAASPGTTIVVRCGAYAENVQITTDRIKPRGLGARLVPPAEPAPNECSFGEPANDGICAVGQLEFPDPEGPPVVADPVEDVSIVEVGEPSRGRQRPAGSAAPASAGRPWRATTRS